MSGPSGRIFGHGASAGTADSYIRGEKAKDFLGRDVEHRTIENVFFIAEERAQDVLESIADAVICTDISGKVTFLNRAAENMTGWIWGHGA